MQVSLGQKVILKNGMNGTVTATCGIDSTCIVRDDSSRNSLGFYQSTGWISQEQVKSIIKE